MMNEEIAPFKALYCRALLAMSNLCYLEIDSTGLAETDRICRFTLLDRDCGVIEDILIDPQMHVQPGAASANGITNEDLVGMPVLADVWPRIQNALYGQYTLHFSRFDLDILGREARRIEWAPAPVVGADLQTLAGRYYGLSYPRLADLCAGAGQPLPPRPAQNALHRATGQRAVLLAMAYPPQVADDDEAPF